jgi:uncharacterized protein
MSEVTEQKAAPDANGYRPSDLTVPTRAKERASWDRELVHSILDEGYVCHLGFVRDGGPIVLPTLYARVGDRLYVHGSTGSRPLRGAGRGPGLPVCLTVTLVDGIVLARSGFHSSVNYRSVVAHGTAYDVTDEAERSMALDALVEHVMPGRTADSRGGSPKELAATAVIRLDLEEVSAKVRAEGPSDDPEDLALPHWAGVLPVTQQYGTPVPADDLDPSIGVPDYVTKR